MHPSNSAHLFGEQTFLHNLVKDHVDFVYDGNLEGLQGAIVSVRGNDNLRYVKELNAELAKLQWCIVIVTGNENSTNFYKQIEHPNCKIWLQTPKLDDEADYYLGFGVPTDINRNLEDAGISLFCKENVARAIDWFFAGQVTHQRRIDCAEALKELPGSEVIETAGFQQGLPYIEYLKKLSDSKYVACPGAQATMDTFRLYEALEMGCVPVIDKEASMYYKKIFPGNPFIEVFSWQSLKSWNSWNVVKHWAVDSAICSAWWFETKQKILSDLFNQVIEMS